MTDAKMTPKEIMARAFDPLSWVDPDADSSGYGRMKLKQNTMLRAIANGRAQDALDALRANGYEVVPVEANNGVVIRVFNLLGGNQSIEAARQWWRDALHAAQEGDDNG